MNTFVVLFLFCNFFAQGYSKCDEGWFENSNENCYKIIDELATQENATEICSNLVTESGIPKLVEILTASEQEFVSSLIFEEQQLFDSVWLGATRYNKTDFQWADGTNLVYSNWQNETPSDDETHNCSQLSSGSIKQGIFDIGQWVDVPCSKRNLVVCQTPTTVTLNELRDMVNQVRKNPVPIGFIYTEYPNKPSPQSIWPSLVWNNVTSEYAGQFFRAEGGLSAGFGAIQPENAPRLTSVQYTSVSGSGATYPENITLAINAVSSYLRAGHFPTSYTQDEAIRFSISGGEVRPLNQAVRIWERVA